MAGLVLRTRRVHKIFRNAINCVWRFGYPRPHLISPRKMPPFRWIDNHLLFASKPEKNPSELFCLFKFFRTLPLQSIGKGCAVQPAFFAHINLLSSFQRNYGQIDSPTSQMGRRRRTQISVCRGSKHFYLFLKFRFREFGIFFF